MKEEMGEEKIEDEINLLDYLIVLAKRKKLIVTITFSVAIITAIFSLTLPHIYLAEAKILIPKSVESGIATQILKQFGGLEGVADSVIGTRKPELFISILKSRSVYDKIIDRFGLMEGYEAENREDAREELGGAVDAEREESNTRIIIIYVKDKDPELAADMANAFVWALGERLRELAVTEASQRRLFFEEQLKQVKETLIESEEALREFQEKTGILKIEEQAKAVIGSIAYLRAQIAAREVELNVMRTYSTSNNPDLQKVAEVLNGLKMELAKLEAKGGSNPDPLMPTGRMPAVGIDYFRKVRDLKYNERLFELMAKQYELARIDEAKDPAIIQIIDKALPPEEKYRPRRRLMVTTATLMSFFFSVLLVFSMEYLERSSKDKESRERIETLKRYLSFKRKK